MDASTRAHSLTSTAWLGQALEEPGQGRVLVVDGGGSKRCALLGDNIAEMAVRNGWSVRSRPHVVSACSQPGRALHHTVFPKASTHSTVDDSQNTGSSLWCHSLRWWEQNRVTPYFRVPAYLSKHSAWQPQWSRGVAQSPWLLHACDPKDARKEIKSKDAIRAPHARRMKPGSLRRMHAITISVAMCAVLRTPCSG